MTDAFDRSQTKRATEAAQADNAAIRAIISRRLLEKANERLDQMDRPYRVFSFGGKDNTYRERILDRPPAGELRNIMTAAAIALDKHLAIDKHDASADAGQVASLLGTLLADLQARHGTSAE